MAQRAASTRAATGTWRCDAGGCVSAAPCRTIPAALVSSCPLGRGWPDISWPRWAGPNGLWRADDRLWAAAGPRAMIISMAVRFARGVVWLGRRSAVVLLALTASGLSDVTVVCAAFNYVRIAAIIDLLPCAASAGADRRSTWGHIFRTERQRVPTIAQLAPQGTAGPR